MGTIHDRSGHGLVRGVRRLAIVAATVAMLSAIPASAQSANSTRAAYTSTAELELVGTERTTISSVDERTGKVTTSDATRYVYRPEPAQSGETSVASSCTYNFTVGTPVRSGSPWAPYIVSQGSLSISSACSSGYFTGYRLDRDVYPGPGGWTEKDRDPDAADGVTVNPGNTRYFYVSRDCGSSTTLENWRARFSNAASPQYNTVYCTA